MMHAVSREVDQGRADGLSAWRVVEIVNQSLLLAAARRKRLAKSDKFGGDSIKPRQQRRDIIARRARDRPLRPSHQKITPAFHVADDVPKSPAERAVAHVERLIQCPTGKLGGASKKQTRRPGVMP